MKKYILGIDGGGTKTRAAILDEGGHLLGTGIGGPSNYDDIGAKVAQKNIGATVEAAWKSAGIRPQPFGAAFLGVAGGGGTTPRPNLHPINKYVM